MAATTKKNEVVKALGLTAKEWEALEHRLSEADAIGEYLAGTKGYAADDVEHVATMLARGELRWALEANEMAVRDILIDAVEGSTYVGCATIEGDAVASRAYDALSRAARKVEAYCDPGRPLRVPDC